jgi:Mg-chelatase subunit ChlD
MESCWSRKFSPRNGGSQRGVALVLAALFCLAVIPVVGLVVDGITAYLIRAEISNALDASVLAGARSLNIGQTIPAQTASATLIARNVFNANVSGMNGNMQNVSASISVGQNDTTHFRWVTATANADLPLTMMGMLGIHTAHISLTATAQRRDVNVVLVLDHSGSMNGVLASMQTDATDFVNMFAGGRDHLGLVTFAGSTFVAYPLNTTFQSDSPNVPALIGQLTTYNGATNTAQAMWAAYQQLTTLNQPGALNVIVVFTDGLANTFAANFLPLVSPSAGCNNLTSPLTGVILSDINEVGTYGLSDPVAQSLNDPSEGRPAPQSNGCGNISDTWNIASGLTGLPSADVNGNSTNGTGSIGAYAAVNLNQVTPASVTNAGLNAFDDAANRIRSDTTLTPVIYTIGLGNNPGLPPDQVLLARVANDPGSPSYNRNQAAGLSIFSPTIAELHSAFVRVASAVLRLAQ